MLFRSKPIDDRKFLLEHGVAFLQNLPRVRLSRIVAKTKSVHVLDLTSHILRTTGLANRHYCRREAHRGPCPAAAPSSPSHADRRENFTARAVPLVRYAAPSRDARRKWLRLPCRRRLGQQRAHPRARQVELAVRQERTGRPPQVRHTTPRVRGCALNLCLQANDASRPRPRLRPAPSSEPPDPPSEMPPLTRPVFFFVNSAKSSRLTLLASAPSSSRWQPS